MEQIKKILAGYIDINVQITESTELINDLGLDSFLTVYFLTQIEDTFGIAIDESEYVDFITVGDVLAKIRQAKQRPKSM